ncbi:MAG TPA: class I SAM-dependent methyltransferase [Candidatus Wallbacteria bacterium]|nr:class I SAM-dependent methyltransferase [Candidatus Wallbacteria bacterium]
MNKYSLSVKKMFGQIAGTYDLLNHVLSIGFDIYWRKKMVAETFEIANATVAQHSSRRIILDIASGTGDVLIEVIKTASMRACQNKTTEPFTFYICSDFSLPMLLKARQKITAGFSNAISNNVSFVICDAQKPCFKNSSIDVITVAFGLRNFPDAGSFFSASSKILNSTGVLSILEFRNILKYKAAKIFRGYYNFFVTGFGKLLSGHVFAYSYLIESIMAFPEDKYICARLEKNNFIVSRYNKLLPYVVSLYIAIINKNGR